jgi:hypothetical protein
MMALFEFERWIGDRGVPQQRTGIVQWILEVEHSTVRGDEFAVELRVLCSVCFGGVLALRGATFENGS